MSADNKIYLSKGQILDRYEFSNPQRTDPLRKDKIEAQGR